MCVCVCVCVVLQVEVKMRKCEGLQWAALEGPDERNHQKLPQMAEVKGDW